MSPVAVLDIGTTKTCALIGELTDTGTLRILGNGIAPSRGLRKGVVVDVKETALAIASAVEQAERVSGLTMEAAYVGIAGAHIQAINARGMVAVHARHGVMPQDIDRALASAEAMVTSVHAGPWIRGEAEKCERGQAVPVQREVLHVIPRGFTLDGQDGIQNPLGMIGVRLEVEAHVVTGASASIQNVTRAVQAAGVQVIDLVLEPLAASEAVLTPAEKEMGVVLVDIGGGTTDIAVFVEGSIWHTVILPTGGVHITTDLAVGLRAPFDAAEEIKLKYGHANPDELFDSDWIDITAFGEEGRRLVTRRQIAEIIHARVEEICQLIRAEIQRLGYDRLLPAGVVLCGGTAELEGIKSVARQVLDLPVRVGKPRDLEGFADRVSSAAFATSIGLLLWGWQQQQQARLNARLWRRRSRRFHPLGGVLSWVRGALLPG